MIARALALSLCLGTAAAAAGQSLEPSGSLAVGAPVRFAVPSPTGRQIAVVCRDAKLRLFAWPGGALARTLDAGDAPIDTLAYSRDGKRLAAGRRMGAVSVFDSRSGAVVYQSPDAKRSIAALALSPDGSRLAVAPLDRPTQVWDVASGTLRAELPSSFAGATALAFSPDGTLLAVANADTSVRVVETTAGRALWSFDELELEPFSIDFTPDSMAVVVGGADKVAVALDARSGTVRRRLPRQPDPIGAVAVLGDGRTVIVASLDADALAQVRGLLAWNLSDGAITRVASDPSFPSSGVVGGGLADGRLLLASAEGETLKLWAIGASGKGPSQKR